jgi:geranylgeranyl reductase family protein
VETATAARGACGALDAEVIVVGAGPAGSATAARIAAAGRDVLIVDRARFPRDKVCGDFVGPVALAELGALGIGDAAEVRNGNAVDRAALFLDGERLMTYVLPHVGDLPTHGRVIPRVTLDAAILDAARRAGARVLENSTVSGLERGPDFIDALVRAPGTQRRLRARVVVGADGSSSLVARAVRGYGAPKDDLLVAVRAYFEGVAGPTDRCDLHFTGDTFPGYAWIFPTSPGFANVGVGMVVETFPRTTEHLRDVLLRIVRTDSGMRARLRDARIVGRPVGWPLCTYDARLPIVAERVVLTGDAAGLINPINGEGIQYALYSARWAAETVLSCLADGDFSFDRLSARASALRAELREDLLLSRLVVRAIANRALNPLWFSILRSVTARASRDPAYARATAGVVAGVVPARETIAAPILLRSVEVLAAALARGGRELLREGSIAAVARICAPAVEVACDPRGARAWALRVAQAARDLVNVENGRARVGPSGREVAAPRRTGEQQ